MLLLEGYISNFTCARDYFFYVEFSDFYVNQSLAGQTYTKFYGIFGRKSFIKCLAFCRVVQPLKISDECLYGNVNMLVWQRPVKHK
jgi:hypothetical protein